MIMAKHVYVLVLYKKYNVMIKYSSNVSLTLLLIIRLLLLNSIFGHDWMDYFIDIVIEAYIFNVCHNALI